MASLEFILRGVYNNDFKITQDISFLYFVYYISVGFYNTVIIFYVITRKMAL